MIDKIQTLDFGALYMRRDRAQEDARRLVQLLAASRPLLVVGGALARLGRLGARRRPGCS